MTLHAAGLVIAVDATDAKTIALVIVGGLWIGILLRLVLSRSPRYREAAQIPLHDEPVTPRGAAAADDDGEHRHA